MLKSFFGDLSPAPAPDGDRPDEAGFAATAILDPLPGEVDTAGPATDRHARDLVVDGSPAQAMREHFAASRVELDTSLITLLDPAGLWAGQVVKALSDAGGHPVERIQLREHTTLRPLATVEHTRLVRRHDDTLRIFYADVHAPGSSNAEIPIVLMERSQMTTVIVGPLPPHAVEALLAALQNAAMLPSWRCPYLLFMLPPGAAALGQKVAATAWPARLQVEVTSEPLTSASDVWNAMLGVWNQVKAGLVWSASAPAPFDDSAFPVRIADLGLPPPAASSSHPTIDASRARAALAGLLTLEGLLGCALVDGIGGTLLARETTDPGVDMEQAGIAGAQLLQAQRLVARGGGLNEPLDELLTSAGARQQLVRPLARIDGICLVLLFERQRANLVLARRQLAEAERTLIG